MNMDKLEYEVKRRLSEKRFKHTLAVRDMATRLGMIFLQDKLFELEDIMPSYFVRISKSTIANIKAISSLRREVIGNGEVTFKNCERRAYFSRGYYKSLREKIDEVRFGK